MGRAGRATKEFGRELSGQGKSSRDEIEKIGRSALIMGGVLAGGLGLSAKAAVDWESSFAGVTKTVDGTTAEISRLEQGLRDMATELPASHGEIAAVAEAAGQLGIKVGDVESFTKVMIDLGETTNLTADQAATSLARIANIMGTSASEVDRMGSTIVELGNNSATTEAEIVELATRLAAAGKIAGLTEADVFAFASTLTSVGVEAEAGGTALSKVFTAVRDAVLDGGESLETFAAVAGVTTSEFSAAFREDAAGAIQLFITGLGEMNDKGQSTTAVFDDLELADQRLMRALLSTASAGDLLTQQLDMAADAWEENNALQTEAEKRYETTGAQLEVLKNKVVDLGIGAGQFLLPALTGVADAAGSMAEGVGELPGPVQGAAVGVTGLSSAALIAVGVVGTFGPKIAETKKILEGMGTAGQFASRNMGRFAAGMGIASVAVAGLSWYLGEQAKKQAEAEEAARGYTEAINEQGTAVGALTDELALQAILEGELGEALRQAGVDLDVFSNGLRDIPTGQIKELQEEFKDFLLQSQGDEVFAMEEALRAAGLAGTELGDTLMFLARESNLTDDQLLSLTQRLEDQSIAHRDGAREADNQAAATDAAGTAAGEAVDPTQEYTDALSDQADSASELEDAIEAISDAYRAQFDPLFAATDALLDNKDALDDARDAEEEVTRAIDARNEAIRLHGEGSEEATEATRDLEDAERDLRDANSAATRSAMDVAIAMGELKLRVDDGNLSIEDAVGILHDWVDQGLITKRQADETAWSFGVAAQAADNLGSKSVLVPVDADTREFWRKMAEIRAVSAMSRYESSLSNPYAITPGFQAAAGGIMEFAAGGTTGAHIASSQVVKYAEPETGGEAYIPRFGDPTRSLGILQQAASWYGASLATGSSNDNRQTNITVNYPKPEPAGDGLIRAARKAEVAMRL